MKKQIWFLVVALVVFLPGCKKYDEGPLMSLYSKGMRVGGTWYFQSVTYDGKDSTANYIYQQMTFIYLKKTEGGAFTWNHNLMATSADPNPLEGGRWMFISDRDSINMTLYKNQFKDTVEIKWKINRLAYTEFWLERTIRDTVTLKWKLIKYAY